MRQLKILLTLLVLAPLPAFPQAAATLRADFNPSAGLLPFPINLLFTGSDDGTLNIPITDPNDPASGPRLALNTLDGFSTVAPLVATFSNGVVPTPSGTVPIVSAIDPASVVAGSTVRLFEVRLVNPFVAPSADRPFAVEGVERELDANQDYIATLAPTDPSGRTVVIVPLRPLKPKTGYLVILTDGIRAARDGTPAVPDQTYILARYKGNHHRPLVDENGRSNFPRLSDAQAQALVPIQKAVLSQEDAASSRGVPKGSIILSWTFLTQSTDDVLRMARDAATPRAGRLTTTRLNTGDLGLGLPGIADIYAGGLQLPYYLRAPRDPADNPIILSTFWRGVNDSLLTRYNTTPVAPQTLTVPLLATVPNPGSGRAKPASGWPVVIFQHGITQNRTNLFAVADTLAAIGFAAVAIDLPLHGITDTANPLYAAGLERTFNVDLVNNETSTPGADGVIDPSGIHFINLASLLTSRDNVRQGVADLFQLAATVPTLDIDGDGASDFDGTQLRFVGHSLGAIVGTPFLGIDTTVSAATLANPGGGIAKLLDGSETIGPRIRAGLAARGLDPGTAAYEAFFSAAQQVLDSTDPINYADAAATNHPIHMIEVVGPPPDATIPNSVAGAPLSGTEPLARVMSLRSTDESVLDNTGIRAIVRFIQGEHSSFLSPLRAPAVTVEMQRQMAGFMASDGSVLPIGDASLLQPVP